MIRLKIADGDQFHSKLGRSASVELGCIKILDNDEKYEQVNQIQNTLDLKILMTKYPEVFDGQVGKLEGKYTININDKAVPVKHAQRTVSVPLRERVRQKLKELEKNKIIQKVNEPSEWISSMVVKIKKIRRYSNLSRSERSKQRNMQGTLSTTSHRKDRNQAE